MGTEPILLRDGTTTADPRLTRLEQFDARSRSWPVTEALSPSAPLLSRSWACVPRLDQGHEGACFPAGTLIRMADGSHKAIDDVRALDEVVTAEGRTGRVMQTMVRHADDLVAVKLRGHSAVAMTPEHPVLTQRGYRPAKDLTTDDRVAVTRYLPDTDTDVVDVCQLVNTSRMRGVINGTVNAGGVITEVAPLPELLYRSPALGRLLGLYAAEGHVTENKVVWTFGGHEIDTLAAETADLIKSVLDAQPRVQQRPNGAVNVILYGKTWRLLFAQLIPGTTKHGDKHLSALVTSGPTPFLVAVLDGWLDGDGHRRRNEVGGVSVSQRLALDMHAIANGAGRMPTIRGSVPSANSHASARQYRWDVVIPTGHGGNRQPTTDSAVWRKVTAIEQREFTGWVYNLHVEGDESYVANGIGVHNCVGFGWSHELAAEPVVVDVDANFARVLYHDAQRVDRFPGGEYVGANPVAPGTSVLAGVQVLHERGLITEYRWAFGVRDLMLAVSNLGPAVIGVEWYRGMLDADSQGFVHAAGPRVGGHCVCLTGISTVKRAFRVHNSWGADWGVNGQAWLSWQDTDRLLRRRGEACIPTGRGTGL